MRPDLRSLLRGRSGAAAAMFALLTPALLGALGFTIDNGLIRIDRTRLQGAADAAALAGAEVLANPTTVAATAQAMAGANMPAASYGTVLAGGDVTNGTWNAATRTFTPVSGIVTPTAVQVTTRRAAANGNAHTLLFGPFVGLNSIDLSASAVAVSRTVETGCNPDYRYNFNNYIPSSTKIVTQGESVQVNGRATYLETTDGHPIVRLDNSFNGQATVVIKIQGAPGGDQVYTFHPPAQGQLSYRDPDDHRYRALSGDQPGPGVHDGIGVGPARRAAVRRPGPTISARSAACRAPACQFRGPSSPAPISPARWSADRA